ncbi:hypothetical protein C4568_04895 [Candidatus Parcubacteria bacterium]|nr:MAG: hypothetical protein C4568_04895 [Candidatus Parcubacteria bacterium]
MRSIERRFNNFQITRPNVSSLLNLAAAVKQQGFSAERVSRALTQLVDKEDYERKDRQAIVRHLVSLSQEKKDAEAYGNRSLNGAVGAKNSPR